ncbi:MAG TPA: aminodeoxychorismate/anthranilate synthase component II [Bacteroidales bacterium]|nr:aminodeoxychorismate/anthranilate synthase component II [Bacteroidales bacterium]
MLKIFLLDNHDSFTYNLAAMFDIYSNVKVSVFKPENTNINKISEYDKIIFSPGPGLPSEHPLIRTIIDKYKNSKNILGICLGHQAIGEYFGCKLKNYDLVNHGMIKKLSIIQPESPIFKNVPDNSEIGVYHSWYIENDNIPEQIRVTGLNEDGIIMAMEHKTYKIQSLQFHPESFITKFGKQMIENWLLI